MIVRISLFLGIIFFSPKSFAQNDSTTNVLGLEDYMQIVLNNHPIVKQAYLITESANAGITEARGHFDPKVTLNYDVKNFKDTEYFDILNATLKVGTWFPIDPKISLDRNQGDFLNPERSIPDSNEDRQVSAGFSIPLGKGLFIDQRRLALKQAKIYLDVAEAERIKLINKTLLKSIKNYWDWSVSYKTFILLEQSVDIAEDLFERVLIDYEYGEVAVIDTIQAKITYQTRLADLEKAKFNLRNSALQLATNLWTQEEKPLELKESTIPDTLASFGLIPSGQDVQNMIEWALRFHPDLQKLNFKIDQLEVENTWNREALKPQVDLSYSFIDAPITPFGETNGPSFNENYKLGLDFSFPILLRKERGKLQKTALKIQSNNLKVDQTALKIKNNILAKYAEIQMSNNLSQQYQAMAQNYNRLLDAELINLETGESDLFKLNIQQDKYINAQIKFLEKEVKFQKNKAELLYESGLPFLDFNEL